MNPFAVAAQRHGVRPHCPWRETDLNFIYLAAVILDLFSPFWSVALWRYLRWQALTVWQAWAVMSATWMVATYVFARFAGYTLGNYLLVFIAFESLTLTGELPRDTKGLTYDHYVTDAQMMFRYWTVPPMIFVIAPTLIMFLFSRVSREKNGTRLNEQA